MRVPEEDFRTLLHAAPDAIVITTADGRIVLANALTERLFGYSRRELIGETVELLVPERFRGAHRGHRQEYRANPRVRPMGAGHDLFGRRRDGTEFPVEISLSPVETSEGMLISAAIRDITSRRQVEEELREAKREAERANVAKSRFLAAASHDLRQPLQAASVYLHVLGKRIEDPAQREILEKIKVSLDALRELLQKLLDISKLEAGVIRPEPVTTSLSLIFERLADECRPAAEAKNLELRVVPTRLEVRTDPQLFSQILQNLLSNAVRYTDGGSILLGCRRRGSLASIQVWDTGMGIPEDKHEEIFEEFTRLSEDPADRRSGVGLGLAIVERLAAVLGHDIRLRSEPGRGTMFEVLVPLAHPHPDQEVEVEEAGERLAGGLIAVIDDEPDVLDSLRMFLEESGHAVVAAGSGAEALERLQSLRCAPDLILSDYQLRGKETGTDAIRRLRAEFGEGIPAILLTGDSVGSLRVEAASSDLPLLLKPVDPAKLEKLLDERLG